MNPNLINFAYLVASVLFIFGLKGLTHPRTAVRGNALGALGMLIAVVVTLFDQHIIGVEYILYGVVLGSLIGVVLALRIPMTAVPEMVALFNGFGGIASVLVAGAALTESVLRGDMLTGQFTVATVASGVIGAVTFWGSLIAMTKLLEWFRGSLKFPGQQFINFLFLLGSIGGG